MAYEILFYNTSQILLSTIGNVYFQGITTLVDIYYGVSTKTRVTENDVRSTFLTATGYIGSPTGRLYVFPTGYNYKYWCIPDIPNEGERVVNQITNGTTNTILVYDSYYRYYQTNPTPLQSITYGKMSINGVTYRIYRTITKTSAHNEQYVSSF